MNVLTLNTHSWMEECPEDKLEQLATRILVEKYDVIALQEVNQRLDSPVAILNDLYCPVADQQIHEDNFALRLVDRLAMSNADYYWTWTFSHIGYNQFHEGLAILSKEPILPGKTLMSLCNEPTSAQRRVLLLGVTAIDDTLVTIANGHFSWWSEDPKAGFFPEWQATERILLESPYPVILMGDFNNPADTTGYQLVLNSSLKLVDAFVAADQKIGSFTVDKSIDGWQDNQGKLRIDYIFSTPELTAKTYQVMFDGISGPIVSDHFGVAAQLTHCE